MSRRVLIPRRAEMQVWVLSRKEKEPVRVASVCSIAGKGMTRSSPGMRNTSFCCSTAQGGLWLTPPATGIDLQMIPAENHAVVPSC